MRREECYYPSGDDFSKPGFQIGQEARVLIVKASLLSFNKDHF